MNIQSIEDFLINNNATVSVESHVNDGEVEYEALLYLEGIKQVSSSYSDLSVEDALKNLNAAMQIANQCPECETWFALDMDCQLCGTTSNTKEL